MMVSEGKCLPLQTGQGALTPLQAANSTASVVKYGTSPTSLSSTANGSSNTYTQVCSPACMPYLWCCSEQFACLLAHIFVSRCRK